MPEITLDCDGLSLNGVLATNFIVSNVFPLFNAQNLDKIEAIELAVRAPDGVQCFAQ